MPLFGAHMSIAGGLDKAISAAVALECQTLQLFTKNTNQWAAKPLSNEEIQRFRLALSASGLQQAAAHDSYLINLAAADGELRTRSIDAFTIELERAEALGLSYLVMHPGAHTGAGEEAGIGRVAKALEEVQRRCRGFRVMVLLETTAGMGTTIGHRFEHLAAILDRLPQPERFGVCVDTCHIFAAGYDITTPAGYEATFQQFEDLIGLNRLKLFHLNDSVKGLGSRVDRHAGIGQGEIGREPFGWLVNDARFGALPMILETPKHGPNREPMDPVNLGILRSLVEGGSTAMAVRPSGQQRGESVPASPAGRGKSRSGPKRSSAGSARRGSGSHRPS